MQKAPKYLLACDVEASGMGVRENSLIQIGFCLVRVSDGTIVSRFSSYVQQPPNTKWEERCVREFWEKHPDQFERAKQGVSKAPPADEVARNLLEWVRTNVTDITTTRLITDTAGFDLAWLDWLLGDRSHLYLFEHDGVPVKTDVLDVGSWYLGLGGEMDPEASSKKAVLRALGKDAFPDFGVVHDHDAANDAALIALRAAWVMRSMA